MEARDTAQAPRRLVNGNAEVEFPRFQVKPYQLASLPDRLMPGGDPRAGDQSRPADYELLTAMPAVWSGG